MPASKTSRMFALMGGIAFAALLAASPARADGDTWNTMLGWVGLGHKHSPDDSTIDYSPRPALVVPPKMDLPPPQTAAAPPQNWPHDPDKMARARADADSRRPAPSSDSSADATTGDFVADADKTKTNAKTDQAVRCSGEGGKGICFYGPSELVDMMKGFNVGDMFGSHTENTSTLRIGNEPPRQYLTQPPPGYQMPKVKGEEDEDSAADASSADTSKYDSVDVGGPRHHHHESDASSASSQ